MSLFMSVFQTRPKYFFSMVYPLRSQKTSEKRALGWCKRIETKLSVLKWMIWDEKNDWKLTFTSRNTYFLRRISHETCEAKYNKFGKKEEKEVDSITTDRTRTRLINVELLKGSCLKCNICENLMKKWSTRIKFMVINMEYFSILLFITTYYRQLIIEIILVQYSSLLMSNLPCDELWNMALLTVIWYVTLSLKV